MALVNFIHSLLFSAALSTAALSQAVETQKPLFSIDKTCGCVKTRTQTSDLTSTEIHSGRTIYQVFKSRTTNRELFRVPIGTDAAKYWNYGLVDDGDFNGDGVEDFSWYGGDDTSDEMLVFLSSANGCRRLDIYRTVARFWVRKFHKSAPDFAGVDGEFQVKEVALVRDRRGLWLAATVGPGIVSPQVPRFAVKIPESHFVYRQETQ